MTRLLLALAVIAAPLAGSAHDIAKGPNGGPVVDSGGHHIELVASGTDLVLYPVDENEKPTSARTGARAIVQQGDKTTTVPLTPALPPRPTGS